MKKEIKGFISVLMSAAMCAAMVAVPAGASETDNGVIVSENFDNDAYFEGMSLRLAHGDWTVSDSNDGDGVTVATDPVTGSKAVKVTQAFYEKGTDKPWTGFEIPFPKIEEGIVQISFDMRAESMTSRFSRSFVCSEDGSDAQRINWYKKDIYCEAMKYPDNFLANASDSAYTNIVMTYDMANKKYNIKSGGTELEFAKPGLTDIALLRFLISANTYGSEDGYIDQTSNTAPVYWVDNISIKVKHIEAESIGYSDGMFSVAFSDEVADAALTDDWFELYCDGTKLDSGSYSIAKSADSGKTVNVTIDDIKYNAEYTLKVKAGLGGANSALGALLQGIEKSVITKAPNIIARDDFEDYEEGAKLSGLGTGWAVSDSNDGDSVTVATDPVTGSKAVKVTQAFYKKGTDKPWTGFEIPFPKIEEGIVQISFDMRAESMTSRFSRSFVCSEDGSDAQRINWYKKDIFCEGMTWPDNYLAQASASSYTNIVMTYDMTNKKYSIKSGGTELEFAKPGLTDIALLRFLISANTYGSEDSYIDQTSNADPVYWIDNISIEKKCIEQESISNSGKEFYVDFNTEPDSTYVTGDYFKLYRAGTEVSGITVAKSTENANRVILTMPGTADYDTVYTVKVKKGVKAANTSYLPTISDTEESFVIKAKTELAAENFDDVTAGTAIETLFPSWSITKTDGSVSVEKDTATDSNALKIVKPYNAAGNSGENGIEIPIGSQKTGKIKLSYSLRTDSNSALLSNFTVADSTDNPLMTYIQYHNSLFLYRGKWQDHFVTDISDKYQKFDITFDMDNRTYAVAVDGKVKQKDIALNDNVTDAAKIKFIVSDNFNRYGADFRTGLTGEGVYWVDNIKVERYTYPEIVEWSVANGAKNVPVDKALEYTFDRAVEGVNYENVHVYKNGTLLTQDEYTVGYKDKKATVSINDGLEYSAEYRIVFENNIASVTGEKCSDMYLFEFTTEDNPNAVISAEAVNTDGVPVMDLSEYKGQTIMVKAKINANTTGYTFAAAIKDSSGRLEKASLIDSEKVSDNELVIKLSVPDTVTSDSVIEGFIWDTKTQAPLDEKLPILKKNNDLKAYVSVAAPSGGDGSEEHPFNTIASARDYARANKTQDRATEIIIREGTYNLGGVLSFVDSDSNTCIRPYGSEKVILRGGKTLPISDFSQASDSRIKAGAAGKVLKVNLNDMGIAAPKLYVTGHSTAELSAAGYSGMGTDSTVYASGEMMRPARYPNEGYMTIKSVTQNGSAKNKLPMIFTADEDMSRWSAASDARVFGYWYYDWSDQTTPVAGITDGTITTAYPSGYGVREGQRFYIYNLLEELDAPGEWFYDKADGNFYFYPPEGCTEVTLCTDVSGIISVDGADSVEIMGLDIQNSGYDAVAISRSTFVTVRNCKVTNAASYGIKAYGKNLRVLENTVSSVGRSGIGTGGGDTKTLEACGNVIRDNKIYDTSKLVTRYTPSLRIEGVGVRAEGNKLYDAPHCAVIFGGNDHVIAGNEIYNVVTDSADSGAIYAGRSAVSRGTQISGNYIHDIATASSHGAVYGIYLDDCMCGVSMSGNRFENISGTGIFVNGGRNNDVVKNSFSNIEENAVALSTAGMTNWYGDDDNFKTMMGLSEGTYKTTPYLKYANLYNMAEDEMRMPKYNVISANVYTTCKNNVAIQLFDSAASEAAVRDANTIED